MGRPFYLAIEGVIGVGKTTLARLLQPRFDAELLLEVFEENPFLSDFYADRERYAFQTQIFFLLSRYRQQQRVQLNNRPLIADYTFAKDRLFAHLNLQGDELEMYERVHRALAEKIILPDLIVYLRASPETLMARIAMRDRPYERGMDPAYIESVRQAYEDHFAQYDEVPVLAIETDELDFVRHPQDLDYVEGLIRTALSAAEVRARIEAVSEPSAEARQRWQVIEEFLTLTKAVGALGAALSSGSENMSDSAVPALNASAESLRRLRVLLERAKE
ncbi:MAG TPA: deoxynucleoside kinase [Anaerolineae bacterium]|nr:deoxynucleoside kinase [Anaerolineae bacterium]